MNAPHYALGFTTLTSEISVPDLPQSGGVPRWLDGHLIRTGPAKFEVGRQRYNHWFDGLAMLHRFSFDDGRVGYANRYLRGNSFQEAMERNAISRGEFATNPRRSPWQKLLPIRRGAMTDNGNVNTSRIGDSMVALTETPSPVQFDPLTLESLGDYGFERHVPGQITTAHPQFDAARRCQYNYLVEFGRTSKYRFYRIDADGMRQETVSTIPVERPSYMHSFGMTERYLVLTEFPLVVNPLKLLLGNKPFIQNYRWQPERGTLFHIVDKETGKVVRTARSEPFFAFHHANAFERDNEVVVDIVVFPDASIIDQLYLDRLRSGAPVATGQLKRFRLDLGAGKEVVSELLSDTAMEFPRFDYHGRAGRAYRYVYGAGSRPGGAFIDQLVKADLETNTSKTWHEEGCYPGEPVFVPAPQPEAEDHGAILAVVLDARAGTSFLLVLDAATFQESARVHLPHHMPFGFHGNFFGRKQGR